MSKFKPLQYLDYIESKYTDIWVNIEATIVECQISNLWNTRLCYVPYGVVKLCMIQYYSNVKIVSASETFSDMALIAALAPWRRSKQTYSFSNYLQNELWSGLTNIDDTKALPTSVLDTLPYKSIFIDCPLELYGAGKVSGFFVSRNYDDSSQTGIDCNYSSVNNMTLEVIFLVDNKPTHAYPIYLDTSKTLGFTLDKIEDFFIQHIVNMPEMQGVSYKYIKEYINTESNNEGIKCIQSSKENLLKALRLVLYLCAKNAEIKENEEQKRIYRKPQTENTFKNKFTEVVKWDVGKELGEAYKNRVIRTREQFIRDDIDNIELTSISHTKSTRKAPHTRSGHFRHYYKDNGVGEKIVVAVWVDDMEINKPNPDKLKMTSINVI